RPRPFTTNAVAWSTPSGVGSRNWVWGADSSRGGPRKDASNPGWNWWQRCTGYGGRCGRGWMSRKRLGPRGGRAENERRERCGGWRRDFSSGWTGASRKSNPAESRRDALKGRNKSRANASRWIARERNRSPRRSLTLESGCFVLISIIRSDQLCPNSYMIGIAGKSTATSSMSVGLPYLSRTPPGILFSRLYPAPPNEHTILNLHPFPPPA